MKSLMKNMVIAVSLMVGLLFGQGAWAIGPGGGLTGEGGDTGAWTLDVTPLDLQGFTGNEPIETFTGTVTAVEKMAGVSDGVQLVLRDETGSKYTILMGPEGFIDNQSLKFAVNDKIEVRGKRVGFYVIASEASKGDWSMRLRNEYDGVPIWQCCFLREMEK